MAKASEKYEVMYIIDPTLGEEATAAVVERFKALVEQNGTLDELVEMGKKKLAYAINDQNEGYYVLMKFTSGPELPAEVDRVLGITEGITKLILKTDDGKPSVGSGKQQIYKAGACLYGNYSVLPCILRDI